MKDVKNAHFTGLFKRQSFLSFLSENPEAKKEQLFIYLNFATHREKEYYGREIRDKKDNVTKMPEAPEKGWKIKGFCFEHGCHTKIRGV